METNLRYVFAYGGRGWDEGSRVSGDAEMPNSEGMSHACMRLFASPTHPPPHMHCQGPPGLKLMLWRFMYTRRYVLLLLDFFVLVWMSKICHTSNHMPSPGKFARCQLTDQDFCTPTIFMYQTHKVIVWKAFSISTKFAEVYMATASWLPLGDDTIILPLLGILSFKSQPALCC